MVGAHKLNEKDVDVIKYLFYRTNLNDTQIAAMFGVSRPHIWKIRNGQRWNENNNSFIMKKDEHQPAWWNEEVEKYIEKKLIQMIVDNLGEIE